MSERVPGFAVKGERIPGFNKNEERMVGLDVVEKYDAATNQSIKIKNSDIYIVRVKTAKEKTFKTLKEFYD